MLLTLKQDLHWFYIVIYTKRIPVQESHLRRRQRRSYGKYLIHLPSFYNMIKSLKDMNSLFKKVLFKVREICILLNLQELFKREFLYQNQYFSELETPSITW